MGSGVALGGADLGLVVAVDGAGLGVGVGVGVCCAWPVPQKPKVVLCRGVLS